MQTRFNCFFKINSLEGDDGSKNLQIGSCKLEPANLEGSQRDVLSKDHLLEQKKTGCLDSFERSFKIALSYLKSHLVSISIFIKGPLIVW